MSLTTAKHPKYANREGRSEKVFFTQRRKESLDLPFFSSSQFSRSSRVSRFIATAVSRMNPYLGLVRCVGLFTTPLLMVWLLAGCASAPKVDWNSRVGNFTYDQAVAELGPPDKSTKLSDGSTVADWITRRSSGVSFGLGTGYSHYGGAGGTSTGVGVGVPVGPTGDHVLRLIFGPDGKLTQWSKS